MKTIGWLLSRMILMRFVTILLGISAFVVSLTLVTYAEEIMSKRWWRRSSTWPLRPAADAGHGIHLHGNFRPARHSAGAG
jgi:hypothetical protein